MKQKIENVIQLPCEIWNIILTMGSDIKDYRNLVMILLARYGDRKILREWAQTYYPIYVEIQFFVVHANSCIPHHGGVPVKEKTDITTALKIPYYPNRDFIIKQSTENVWWNYKGNAIPNPLKCGWSPSIYTDKDYMPRAYITYSGCQHNWKLIHNIKLLAYNENSDPICKVLYKLKYDSRENAFDYQNQNIPLYIQFWKAGKMIEERAFEVNDRLWNSCTRLKFLELTEPNKILTKSYSLLMLSIFLIIMAILFALYGFTM